MNKAAALEKSIGANIQQSIGVREQPAEGSPRDVIPIADEHAGKKRDRARGLMDINNVIPDPDQPRKTLHGIDQLASSIKRHGLLQEIVVRWSPEHGKHIITSGNRRYLACKQLGHTEIPCYFQAEGEELPESEIRLRQLTENLQRDEIPPREAASAFKQLQELNDWSAQQVAEALCVSKSLVVQRLQLLNLPEEVQEKVELGTISPSAGYQISKLKDADEQREMAARVEKEKLTRDDIAAAVKEKSGKPDKGKPKAGKPVTKEDHRLECGCRITLTWNKKRVTKADRIKAAEELLERFKAA